MRRRASSPALSYVPLVLINSSRPDTETKQRGIALDDHIRPGEVRAELRPIVRRLAIRVASANLIRDSSLPDALRRVFEVMCYHEPNPIQLNTVYRIARVARSTVNVEYNRHVRQRTGRALEYVHEEIALIRCLGWKSPRRSWHDAVQFGRCSLDWIDRALSRQSIPSRSDLNDARVEAIQLRRLPELLWRILAV